MSIKVLEVVVEGVCKMSSSCVESTQLDIWSSRVDSVRLSIEVLKVVVEGVYKMSSSRVELLQVNTTQHLEKSSQQSETCIKVVLVGTSLQSTLHGFLFGCTVLSPAHAFR